MASTRFKRRHRRLGLTAVVLGAALLIGLCVISLQDTHLSSGEQADSLAQLVLSDLSGSGSTLSSTDEEDISSDATSEEKEDTAASVRVESSSEGLETCQTDYGAITSYRVEASAPEAASELIERYQEQGSCVLVRAGYLDLVGNVWSCTVSGGTWVETCLVCEDDGISTVCVIRMEADRVEELYEEMGWSG